MPHRILAPWISFALLASTATGSPTVWSGFDFSFTKLPNADYLLPENQDFITENVILTRAELRGIFNIAQETEFVQFTSPEDTRWATQLQNPEATIEATNWEALSFTTWTAAYGGSPVLSNNMTAFNAVLHLITDDIYLDIRFTSWGEGSAGGGGFAYERAMAPVASGADFNGDGEVNGLDLEIWETHFGSMGAAHGDGDANLDGMVDGADFLIWQQEFTATAAAAAIVPEPSGLLIMALCGVVWAPSHRYRLSAVRCQAK